MTDGRDRAFPGTELVGSQEVTNAGMTKREYFAIKILAGFAADPQCDNYTIEDNVETAVIWADTLIAELNKPAGAEK